MIINVLLSFIILTRFTMISTIAIGGLAKRLVEDPPAYKFPDYAPIVFLADFILFLPVLIIVSLPPSTPFYAPPLTHLPSSSGTPSAMSTLPSPPSRTPSRPTRPCP